MARTEIWLRLMYVGDLYGEAMLNMANSLIRQPQINRTHLQEAGLTARQAERFLQLPAGVLDETLRWLELPQHHFLCADSEIYPPQLRAIDDYPGAIFIDGDPACLHTCQLAVVGSRSHSWYGERWGRLLCESLAKSGLTITSGLARGIDGVAHNAAMSMGGKSVAVLGNGLAKIYPRRHAMLAENLIATGGAVVSEFPLSTPPLSQNFPRRNRIISGLSKGVLVIEAALPFPELLANVGDEVTPVDVVAERAGQPVPAVVAQLLELELAGWIAAVPGGYVRLRRASHVRRTNVFV
ncbi:TPA: DNA-protecting protein DprA [Salmonella enterica subsp. enterica serovar Typhi]|nr:DNA-protecting protein DprA [Salmonella enterica subsp. enterica serovar Typhi]HDW5603394.1 DNA-protecting protein DprA [Salmonella enterica subsp. enterica serovar Typhi]